MWNLVRLLFVTVFVTPLVIFASERPVLKTTITITRELSRINGPGTVFRTMRANRRTQQTLIRPDQVASSFNDEDSLADTELELVTSKLGYINSDFYSTGRQRVTVRADFAHPIRDISISQTELARVRSEAMAALQSSTEERYKSLTGMSGKAQLILSDLSCLMVDRAMECSETIQLIIK